jgi:integrase
MPIDEETTRELRRRILLSEKSVAVPMGLEFIGPEQLPLDLPGGRMVPTLAEFAPRFLDEYCRANRQKPRGIGGKDSALRLHLLPFLGHLRLDQISTQDIQRLKAHLAPGRKSKTVNNILSVLSKILHVAEEWDVMETSSAKIRPMKNDAEPEMAFYEYDAYAKLIEGARRVGTRAEAFVLLGGDAGLRLGEIIGLEWEDVDFVRRSLNIRRSVSRKEISLPKGGRSRRVQMSACLLQCLTRLYGVEGRTEGRVLLSMANLPLTDQSARGYVGNSERAAGMKRTERVHILRHTFCSHLAMRGASTVAIKELAGHTSLKTTQRYMHLAPEQASAAISLIDNARGGGIPEDRRDSDSATSAGREPPAGIEKAGGWAPSVTAEVAPGLTTLQRFLAGNGDGDARRGPGTKK